MSTEINIKKRITALDESVILTKDLNSIDFASQMLKKLRRVTFIYHIKIQTEKIQ